MSTSTYSGCYIVRFLLTSLVIVILSMWSDSRLQLHYYQGANETLEPNIFGLLQFCFGLGHLEPFCSFALGLATWSLGHVSVMGHCTSREHRSRLRPCLGTQFFQTTVFQILKYTLVMTLL
jgi:hypothetical protein